MNCEEVQELLHVAELPADAAAFAAHLQTCAACQRVRDDVQALAGRLNETTAPRVEVNLARLYREAEQQQVLRTQRWRRLAYAGLAAALLLGVLTLFEWRVEQGQLVVRWGRPGPDAQPAPAAVRPAATLGNDEGVRLLAELVQLWKRDFDERDMDRQRELASLRAQLQIMQFEADQRWADAERNVKALYLLSTGERP
jgi:hypothetical protein